MDNEIFLYSPFFSFTAEFLMNQLNEFSGEDVQIRVNSPGGSVYAGWGVIAKTQEHTGNIKIKVDGHADSMAAVLLLFHDDVEALDVSHFVLHRASTFSTDPDDLIELKKINKDLRAAMESKLDIPAFEKIAGVSLDTFFDSENVIDVGLTATQAKKIGLIKSIKKLVPAEFQALNAKFAAMSTKEAVAEKPSASEEEKVKQKTKKNMTLEQFKAQHPELFGQVVAIGVTEERDRASAWLVYNDVDPNAVSKGIEDGSALSAKQTAEFNRKLVSATAVNTLEEEGEGAEPVATTEEEPKASTGNKELDDFTAKVESSLGLGGAKK